MDERFLLKMHKKIITKKNKVIQKSIYDRQKPMTLMGRVNMYDINSSILTLKKNADLNNDVYHSKTPIIKFRT